MAKWALVITNLRCHEIVHSFMLCIFPFLPTKKNTNVPWNHSRVYQGPLQAGLNSGPLKQGLGRQPVFFLIKKLLTVHAWE